ncbi:hypothetical protein RRF57_013227 [Xylaria bambusicola]|uniref:Uncharacterized protein n=1 Tax=Xylaria bambusicola TaxID=326684 RepID=A0AAN7UWG9_9PEZI
MARGQHEVFGAIVYEGYTFVDDRTSYSRPSKFSTCGEDSVAKAAPDPLLEITALSTRISTIEERLGALEKVCSEHISKFELQVQLQEEISKIHANLTTINMNYQIQAQNTSGKHDMITKFEQVKNIWTYQHISVPKT